MINLRRKKEYHYKDEYGNCKIIDKGDLQKFFAMGKSNSKQIFKNNKNTLFSYITKQFHGKYKILQKKLKKKMEKIMLEYDIIDGNEVINSINLEVQFIDI